MIVLIMIVLVIITIRNVLYERLCVVCSGEQATSFMAQVTPQRKARACSLKPTGPDVELSWGKLFFNWYGKAEQGRPPLVTTDSFVQICAAHKGSQ